MRPAFFSGKIKILKQTGCLDFSGDIDVDDRTLRNEEYSKHFSLVKDLNISSTNITTLSGVKPFPSIRYFNANNSKLRNFHNFGILKNCISISVKHTPLASHPNLRLILYLIIGDSLISVNGTKISDSIKKLAKTYDPIYGKLISAGWDFQKEQLSDEEITKLCRIYDVQKPESNSPIKRRKVPHKTTKEEQNDFDYDNQRSLILEMEEEEDSTGLNSTIRDVGEFLEKLKSELNEPTLAERISEVLEEHGIKVNPKNKHSIIREIKTALDTITLINISNSSLE